MKAIIDHLDHITQLHGSPVAKEALSAQVIREQNLNVNFQSLVEVLRSHRFENQISHRDLKDIPSLSTPVFWSYKMKKRRLSRKLKVQVRTEFIICIKMASHIVYLPIHLLRII